MKKCSLWVKLLPSISRRVIWQWAFQIQRTAIFAVEKLRLGKQQKLSALCLCVFGYTNSKIWLTFVAEMVLSHDSEVRSVDICFSDIFLFGNTAMRCCEVRWILGKCMSNQMLKRREKNVLVLINLQKISFLSVTWETKDIRGQSTNKGDGPHAHAARWSVRPTCSICWAAQPDRVRMQNFIDIEATNSYITLSEPTSCFSVGCQQSCANWFWSFQTLQHICLPPVLAPQSAPACHG